MAPLLALERIGKKFRNGTEALAAVDLSVAPGAFLSLLGPSGCGKSTLLRIIAGLTPPSSGTLRWTVPQSAGQIGFVFQEPTLMPWATVRENVYLPLRLAGVARPAAAARIDAVLASVGLAGFEQV